MEEPTHRRQFILDVLPEDHLSIVVQFLPADGGLETCCFNYALLTFPFHDCSYRATNFLARNRPCVPHEPPCKCS